MPPTNTLSELQKRSIAYSGQADIGDVPPLYALRRAQEQAAAEQALGGGAGLPSGVGGAEPLGIGGGGGGAVTGGADIGLPGAIPGLDAAAEQALTRGYREAQGRADPREAPGRVNSNPEVEAFLDDYFGFLKNPAVLGVSAPFVGPVASILGPYFGATDIPEAAPLGPTSLIQHLLGTATGGGGEFTPEQAFGLTPGIGEIQDITNVLGGLGSGDRAGGDRGRDRGFGDRGRGTCFAPGTKILMADMTEKPIEEIKLGDEVMGFREGEHPEKSRVTATFAHSDIPVVRLNGDTLVTRNHKFFTQLHGISPKSYAFTAAEDIPLGSHIMGIEGEDRLVETIEDAQEYRTVYNFTVEHLNTYFANGYRVHNKDVA